MTDKYNDMLDLPHHVSSVHAQMPRRDRAAQFSPFAALTGLSSVIRESARETETERIADEQRKSEINRRLTLLAGMQKGTDEPVQISYFRPDERKEGGMYVTVDTFSCRVNEYTGKLILDGGREIDLSDVWDIQGKLFDDEDNCVNGDMTDEQYI